MSDNENTTKKLKFKKLTVKSGIRAGGDSIVLVSDSSSDGIWSHTNSAASTMTITYPTKKCSSSPTNLSTSVVVSY